MDDQTEEILDPITVEIYRRSLEALDAAGVEYLVGGAYAFACYTEISRHTKDFDLFLRSTDLDLALDTLEEAGFRTEVTFPHWLAKAFDGEEAIDLIFRSGNGTSEVDDAWFERATAYEVFGRQVLLCPPEEIIWSKAYVQERERFDGADIAHLLLGCAGKIDWDHLIWRFGAHWRVLLGHLLIFGFIYPGERDLIPRGVMLELMGRVQRELDEPPPAEKVCQGTLLSRAQYLVDIDSWGYQDARLQPSGDMTAQEISHWTEAIEKDGKPHPTPAAQKE